MKHLLLPLILTLTACQSNPTMNNEPKPIGYAPDAHGCNAAAGLSYSKLLQQCVQPWDAATIKLNDPDNETATVYIIIASDQSAAEVFAIGSRDDNQLLQPIKGGYANHHYQLMKTVDGWKFQHRRVE